MSTSAYKRVNRARATQDLMLRAVIANHTPSEDHLAGIVAGRRIEAAGPVPITAANPAAVPHPLGPPVVSGTNITVDLMLQQPTRITKMIMDLTLQRFVADRIFASAGGVQGGAVVYDEATVNELWTTRDIERIEPGMEVPILTSERPQPKVALVEKWGGKVWISDEAKDRNNSAEFARQVRQVANTVVRKLNQRAIEVLEASITASGQIMVGRNWSIATDVGPDAQITTRQNLPFRDFALVQRMADEDELGVNFTLWLLNPQEYSNLVILYGAQGLRDILQAMGVDIYVSNRIAAGTAYVVAGTSTGEMRVEQPLRTVTWREEGRERTWVQSTVRPVMFVTNPFAVMKVTGLAG